MKVTLQNMIGSVVELEVPDYDDAQTAAIKVALMTGIPNKVVEEA